MRWLILVLLLIAAPARALVGSTGRLAVFYEGHPLDVSAGWATNNNNAASGLVLARSDPPMDYFNASARTWGESGVADSTWFRQRYDAVLIMHQTGQATGTPVASSMWGTKFQNAAGATGISRGPMSGRWPIPVFAICPNRLVPTTTSYDDSSGTNFNAGITVASPAGSFTTPAVATGGTWRYRLLYRWRDSEVDTLYGDTNIFGCVDAPWPGPGSVAAIAWADTFPFGSCGASDTAAVAWRYRPRDDVPGIYYLGFESGLNNDLGTLMALQYIYALTPIKPRQLISIPLLEHNPEPPAITATYQATAQAVYDTMNAYGLRRNIYIRAHPNEYAQHGSADLARIRTEIARGSVWQPFSSSAGWTCEFYSTADTAGFRSRWNRLIQTCTAPDSFALPIARMSNRMTPASGLAGVWLGKTLKDSGFDIVESTLSAPSAAGWSFQVAPDGGPTTCLIPGDDQNRTIRVENAYGFLHDSTFSAAKGTEDGYGYVGRLWMGSLWHATQYQSSLYFHGGGTVGVYHTDHFWSWLMSVAGRHFRYFDRVIQTTVDP